MRKTFFIITMFACTLSVLAQRERRMPKSMVVGQFAGSTGLISAGFSKVSAHDKVELGLLYGYLPRAYGGTNHSLSFKFAWNPIQIRLMNKIHLEPIQAGGFISQNFNKNLDFTWGKNYPRGYYWWPRATRFHPFLASQVSYMIESKHIDRIAYYFEANTNDLYIASYYQNQKALSFYDIVFFGMGLKLYFN